jgi:hypothetical protein
MECKTIKYVRKFFCSQSKVMNFLTEKDIQVMSTVSQKGPHKETASHYFRNVKKKRSF